MIVLKILAAPVMVALSLLTATRSSMDAAVQSLFLFRGRSGRPGCGHPPSGTATIQRTSRPSSPGSDQSQSSLFPRLPPLVVSI